MLLSLSLSDEAAPPSKNLDQRASPISLRNSDSPAVKDPLAIDVLLGSDSERSETYPILYLSRIWHLALADVHDPLGFWQGEGLLGPSPS